MPVAELTDAQPVAELDDKPPIAELSDAPPQSVPKSNPRPIAGRLADFASLVIGEPSGLGLAGFARTLSNPLAELARASRLRTDKSLIDIQPSSVPKGAAVQEQIAGGLSDFIGGLIKTYSTPDQMAPQNFTPEYIMAQMITEAPEALKRGKEALAQGDYKAATESFLPYVMGAFTAGAVVDKVLRAAAPAIAKMPLAAEEARKAEAENASESTKTGASPTTNPKPIDTELVVPSTIPESPATLQAQSALALDKSNPSAVVYAPVASPGVNLKQGDLGAKLPQPTGQPQLKWDKAKPAPEPSGSVAESPPPSSGDPPVTIQPEAKGNVKASIPEAQALKIGDSINPQHIRQDTWKPIPERWADTPVVLGRELTKGGRVAGSKTATDSQSLVALEKNGEVAVVSAYRDPADGARLRHPDLEKTLRPNRSLKKVLASGWKPIWSANTTAPTRNFLQKFSSVEAFENSTGLHEANQQSAIEEAPAGFEQRGEDDPAKLVAATMPPEHEMTPFINRDESDAIHGHFSKHPTMDAAIEALPKAKDKELVKSGILKAIDSLNKSDPSITPDDAWGQVAKEFYERSQSAKSAEAFGQSVLETYGPQSETDAGGLQRPNPSASKGEGATFYANPIVPLAKSLGIKEFAEADLKPLLKNGVNAVRAAADVIIDTLSPTSRAQPLDVDELFKSKGFKEQVLTRVTAVLDHAGTMLDRMPIPDQVAFADRVKRGLPQTTPELQQVADLIRKWDDYLYRMASRYNPDLPYKENHLRVLWKVVPGSPEAMGASKGGILGKRPWQGSKGFLRKATLQDMSEGITNGGVPVTYNPVDLFYSTLRT